MPLARARRFVQVGLLLAVLGVAAITTAGISGVTGATRDITILIGFIAAGTGLLLVYVGWRTLRLASDDNVIARWTVTPDEWERHVAACRMREEMPGALPGTVPLDLDIGSAGIEVVALRRGFRVGDTFHEIGTLGAEVLDMRVVDSPVRLFEFNLIIATGRTSSIRRGVRIPVAADAAELADRVEDHWIRSQPLQTMSIDQLQARERSGWMLALAGLIAFLGVITIFVLINPPGWAAAAPIGTLALTMYGSARGLRARSVRQSRPRD